MPLDIELLPDILPVERMKQWIYIVMVAPLLLSAAFIDTDTCVVQRPEKKAYAALGSKLSSSIQAIVARTDRASLPIAAAYARGRGFTIKDTGSIVLQAEMRSAVENASVIEAISRQGGRVFSEYRNQIEFEMPIAGVDILESMAGVRKVQKPLRPYPHVINGQEVALTKALQAHAVGNRGANVKVAVIDGGFISNEQAIAAGELPANLISYDFSGRGLATDSAHGTAVAEIVHEMAPDAQLYLLKINSSVELGKAKDYCIMNGIHIVNHSMGWFGSGWGDGKGPICDIANDAYSNGVLWVNSAGNSAKMHWQGSFNDPNGDRCQEFSGMANINQVGTCTAGSTLTVFLSWDDPWGGSANDYDLLLLYWTGSSWTVVYVSEDTQNGNDDPVEAFSFPISATGYYGVAIYRYSGSARPLQLYCYEKEFQYATAASSITSPADAAGVLAVGAIAYNSWPSGPIESFSSQGPTQDARVKPDLCGVDRPTNFIYGSFSGTSCASPCVAGAAAVIWSAYKQCSAKDVWNALKHYAIDVGPSGVDNQYGAGAVDITIVRRFTPINNAYRGKGDVVFDAVPRGATVSIYTVSGKFVAALLASDDSGRVVWNVRNPGGQPVGPGIYNCTVTESNGKKTTSRLMITRSRD